MNSSIVVDTFAWIEYFRGSGKGKVLDQYLRGETTLITPTIVLAELSDVYHREKNVLWERDLIFIVSKSVVQELTLDIAARAGKIKNEARKKQKRFGLADAIILSTAKALKGRVLSGDKHFKGLKEVEYLGD